jgi:hypothetical protein
MDCYVLKVSDSQLKVHGVILPELEFPSALLKSDLVFYGLGGEAHAHPWKDFDIPIIWQKVRGTVLATMVEHWSKTIESFRLLIPDTHTIFTVLANRSAGCDIDFGVGFGAVQLADEVVLESFGSLNQDQQQWWRYEGKCPKCGESGRLDPCGGANCSKHGFYQLELVPKPQKEMSLETPKPMDKFPFESWSITAAQASTKEGILTSFFGTQFVKMPDPYPRHTKFPA